jgi:hypothetical protein
MIGELRMQFRTQERFIASQKIQLEKTQELEVSPELSRPLDISHLSDLFEEGSDEQIKELLKGETISRKNALVAKKSGKPPCELHLSCSSGAAISTTRWALDVTISFMR